MSIGGAPRGGQDEEQDAGKGEEEAGHEGISGPSERGNPIDGIAPGDETGDPGEDGVSASKGHALGHP